MDLLLVYPPGLQQMAIEVRATLQLRMGAQGVDLDVVLLNEREEEQSRFADGESARPLVGCLFTN